MNSRYSWLFAKKKQLREQRKVWNSDYYESHRDEILAKRKQRYKETGQ